MLYFKQVTKLRSQLTTSLAQLNELESLNCQLREKIVEYQNTIYSLQRSLDEKNCQNGTLAAENSRLAQAQMEMMSMSMVALGKPLTEELLEIESDEGCMSSDPVVVADAAAASLDDFQEISLPTTPTVVDGCNNVFEEHFKVLESLENYLESQHLIGATMEDNDESGISTSPSIHEVMKTYLIWLYRTKPSSFSSMTERELSAVGSSIGTASNRKALFAQFGSQQSEER